MNRMLLVVLAVITGGAAMFFFQKANPPAPPVAPAPVAPAPAAAPAAAPQAAAPAAAPVNPRQLSDSQRQTLITELGGPGSSLGNPVWFAVVPNNPEAAAFQKQLQSAFEEAGWKIRGVETLRFQVKAGVHVFAADELPSNYIEIAENALNGANVPVVSSGRGYRAYVEEKKKENPDYVGIDLAPNQDYVIVVGRRPPEDAPAAE